MEKDRYAMTNPRIKPLVACLAAAAGIASSAFFPSADAGPPPAPLGTPAHAAGMRGSAHRGRVVDVPSCSEAALRSSVIGAMSGDVINMPMNCSLITLTAGAIPVTVDDLSLIGPGADAFTIDGGVNLGSYDRVFRHTGIGTLYVSGMTITNSALKNSMEANGGCIDSDGAVVLAGSTLTGCYVQAAPDLNAKGGAVYGKLGVKLYSSTVTQSEVHASATGGAFGGGVFSRGDLYAKYSTVSYCVAAATSMSSAIGGGSFVNYGSAKLLYSTISDNQAQQGGGIFVGYDNGSTVTITDSTISGNYASEFFGGAALLVPSTISNSTVASNTAANADFGIGVYAHTTLTAQSSIFSNNMIPAGAGGDLGMDVYSVTGTIDGEKNIIIRTPNNTPADTSQNCPRLGPLADNGGPTLTHALLSGSPAIDAGSNPLGALYDQRFSGFSRTFGAATDIGAYEWQGNPSDEIFSSRFEVACD